MNLDTAKVLVAISAFLLCVQAIRAVALYGAVASLTKGEKRQLPIHVASIAFSYLVYLIATTAFLLFKPYSHTVDTIRTTIFGLNSLVGHYALFNVLSYDRRRLSKVTNFQEPDDV